VLLLLAPTAWAQEGAPSAPLPEGVVTRHADVWSDGTRISGDLFFPPGFVASEPHPAVLMSHGWGGVRSHLNQAYAPFIAAAGYVVLTIDYRGWGDSDSRLVIKQKEPLETHAVRELVDPFDQTEDIRSALSFLEGEPGVDADRIGLWGSSYSGGHVIWVAAHDPRVKATVSQVGSMDSTDFVANEQFLPGGAAEARKQAIQRARGEIEPVPQSVAAAPGLRGVPFYSRMAHYSPRAVAHLSKAPALIIDAEKEELFDAAQNGRRVAEILKENGVPVRYHVVPGITHYQIYREKREEALRMAIEWYDEHLKKKPS
jgi:dipeptidyl aminopeptidase/acylaminoacyl peptidase